MLGVYVRFSGVNSLQETLSQGIFNLFMNTKNAMARGYKDKDGLTNREIQKFKTMLLVKRKEILGNVTCMEDEALRRERNELSNMPMHMADAGSDNYEVENTLGLMDSERKLLEQINDALGRIENGTYRICLGNGKPIPKARLAAILWAKYCIECANLVEKGGILEDVPVAKSNYDNRNKSQKSSDNYILPS